MSVKNIGVERDMSLKRRTDPDQTDRLKFIFNFYIHWKNHFFIFFRNFLNFNFTIILIIDFVIFQKYVNLKNLNLSSSYNINKWLIITNIKY